MLKGGGEEARAFRLLAKQVAGVSSERKGFLQRFQDAWERIR
jgi:hypothetical protein